MTRDTLRKRIRFVLSDPRFSLLNRLEYLAYLAVTGFALGAALYYLGYLLWELEFPRVAAGVMIAATTVLIPWAGRVHRVFLIPYFTTAFQKEEGEVLLQRTLYYRRLPGVSFRSDLAFGKWASLTLLFAIAMAVGVLAGIPERLGLPEWVVDYVVPASIVLVAAVGIPLAARAYWLTWREWLRSEPGRERQGRGSEAKSRIIGVLIGLALIAWFCARQGAK